MMFVTKGRLKVSLLVVGVLVAGLGMYAAFQPKPAEADCNTIGRIHAEPFYDDTYDYGEWTGEERETSPINCSKCQGYPKSIHKEKKWVSWYDVVVLYKHRWFWKTTWDYCHAHTYRIGIVSWYLIRCNKSGGDDN